MSEVKPAGRLGLGRAVLVAVVLVNLFVVVAFLQRRIDERFGQYRVIEEILYIESGEALKKVVLGFNSLAADVYWLRTVQYFGGQRRDSTEKRFELLEPLLNITTTLDPNLKVAYTYGATFLSESWPRGADAPHKGLALIDKGIENHPDHWRFYLDKGFIYFWFLEDYEKAAEIFLEGSRVPGAPYWMMATAGRTLARGGERNMARELWKLLYDAAENEQMRNNALIHLRQLDALEQVDVLIAQARRFEAERGHFPATWQEMIATGYLRDVPVDPAGVPYVLNPGDKGVEISETSSLAGLPTR